MGAAVGSIMANVIAAHISATRTRSLPAPDAEAVAAVPRLGRQSAAASAPPRVSRSPAAAPAVKRMAIQASPARTAMQTNAGRRGRASTRRSHVSLAGREKVGTSRVSAIRQGIAQAEQKLNRKKLL